MGTGYEHQATDHNASIRAEVPDPDQVKITITHGEDESAITMWAEDFDTMVREDARPAAPSAPATPAVGVRTSEGATGAPGGAHGISLGGTLRHIADSEALVLGGYVMERLAERADALEALRTSIRALADHPSGIASSRDLYQALIEPDRPEVHALLTERAQLRDDLDSWGDDGPEEVITPLLARFDEVLLRLRALGWGDS